MMTEPLVAAGALLAGLGVLVLRLSWGRAGRDILLNTAGWAALALSVLFGALAAGAWGIAVVALWAMTAAFVFLALAAFQSSPTTTRRTKERRADILPDDGESLRFGGRAVTFVLVGVMPLISSVAVALFVRRIALICGAMEGNASVLALFAAPLTWTILSYTLLMTDTRKMQFTLIGGSMLTALPAVLSGEMA